MFETTVGPVKETGSVAYLRPETAQGIFINFKNVLQFSRKKPPFGIAQIGKSFRNEITPGNFIFRTREFDQMEMEFFVPPAESPQWYDHWKAERRRWYEELGIRPDHLRLREHDPDELSHYSSGTADVEYLFPIGWSELEGIANRTDFDLKAHAEHSGTTLEYFDPNAKERYVPHVIEPAAGADRATLAFLADAYDEEEVEGESRTVLKLHPRLAPVKVAVLPLVQKDGQPELAREVVRSVRPLMQTEYDEGGSIGKRYRRQDEIGTPWCVTVDHQSLEDRTVTLRDRDTLEQVRVAIDDLPESSPSASRAPGPPPSSRRPSAERPWLDAERPVMDVRHLGRGTAAGPAPRRRHRRAGGAPSIRRAPRCAASARPRRDRDGTGRRRSRPPAAVSASSGPPPRPPRSR
jgi:glycyl-tRNA synthetase